MRNVAPKSSIRHDAVVEVADSYPKVAAIPAGASNVVVVQIQGAPNLKPLLKKIGNTIADATGAPYITWALLVNGGTWPKLESISNMLSDPGRPDQYLPYEDELPTGALIQLVASNSDTVSHTVVGRVVVWYEGF